MTGLPPSTRDADIDRAAPGYDEPPFYCSVYEGPARMHCSHFNKPQCGYCQCEEYLASLGEPPDDDTAPDSRQDMVSLTFGGSPREG